MRQTLHAEWTKLRTVPGTGWLLLASVVLTVAVSATVSAAAKCPSAACHEDATKISLTGIELGQATVALLAVLAVSGEYSAGMIRTTLVAMPRRLSVLVAKAAVVTGVVLAAGTLAVVGSLLAGWLILPGNGFIAAHGNQLLSLSNGSTLRAAIGSVLYLALIGLLSLGAATALRESATAIAVVLGLLYLFPIMSHLITNAYWRHHLQQLAPMTAGLAIQATTGLRNLPIQPWPGLGVLAAYAAAALITGGLLLQLRDT